MILLRIPPLRERPEDIAALAETFLRAAPARPAARIRFSPAAMARLDADPWPGNIRQLRNRVFRAVLFCKGEEVGCRGRGSAAAPQRDDAGHVDGDEKGFEAARLGFEREFLFRGLRRTEGNVVRLAAESASPVGRCTSCWPGTVFSRRDSAADAATKRTRADAGRGEPARQTDDRRAPESCAIGRRRVPGAPGRAGKRERPLESSVCAGRFAGTTRCDRPLRAPGRARLRGSERTLR